MIKIRIHMFGDSIGLQLFDRYYAFKQSFNAPSYQANIQIEYGPPRPDSLNIAFATMPSNSFCDFADYDFVFVDNAGEPLEVCTSYIIDIISKQNVYFVCGAFLDQQHPMASKIIPYNHNIRFFHDCMTRGFYPQYFERARHTFAPTKNMIYINGSNRSWRKYFIDSLAQIPAVDIKSSIGNEILETAECEFEDPYDFKFRNALNQLYPDSKIQDYNYDNNSVEVGIDSKFGQVPPGYFLFDAYYQYHCIIFPETGWVNNQHFATEKIYKCFVSGAIPFPISGARTHQLYNKHGYYTAWNLLPPDLQDFDNELDHQIRVEKTVQAIKWLNASDAFTSTQAQYIRQQNQNNFYKNTLDLISVEKLDSILKQSGKYIE